MANEVVLPLDKARLRFEVGQIFNPSAPINEKELFAGRTEQLNAVIDAVSQRGQHAVIFGERGVGKTSLATVLSSFLESNKNNKAILAPRVTCHVRASYSKLWKEIFDQIEISNEKQIGFSKNPNVQKFNISETLPPQITPHVVSRVLKNIGSQCVLIIIIDEFDRIFRSEASKLFADTIKMLSDGSVPVTLVLVGVADGIDQLIANHQSVGRALAQIRLPRMSQPELQEIIDKGLAKVNMQIDSEAKDYICHLSQGLPYYTHLLAQHSAYTALEVGQTRIKIENVQKGVEKAIERSHESLNEAYSKATASSRKEHLYKQVLLACALARTDERGQFPAVDVRQPMSAIMKKFYDIPAFARHLIAFCGEERGAVLEKGGRKHRHRFRFKDPLIQPYIILRGLADRKINRKILEKFDKVSKR